MAIICLSQCNKERTGNIFIEIFTLIIGDPNVLYFSYVVPRLSFTCFRPTLVTVSCKLPTFWPADPELWFAQVDAQFRVTSQATKFEYVIATLDPQYAAEVRDLILKPPDADPYDRLKEELIKRTTASEQRRLQLPINAEDLGDRTPSQLLRHTQQLLGGKAASFNQSFLRQLFLQRLPPNVCMVLASTKDDEDLESLASLADKVVEVASRAVNAVQTTELSTEVEQLRSDIATLKKLVTSLSDLRHPRSFRRRTPSPAPPDRPTTLCWYHAQFAEKATKCTKPCSWSQGNVQANR
ncbi:PREDICTED: uncharacterized protein LOC105312074 [Amphimedon queenslandica]|uniref:DUF7041 domain-containing protein n=1 Tax=Amphimedon queenslandica TaxID=400682 RepID=A0AAN0IK08_AMPQE|nr:PREDICTED: uncharacterized protein LOC105312074 [Amphimedon queenslandica]|eukprot:XP_011402733.1 PREDICTED: uncharacterized protein LOC105312074 [Amphimedon queenslandica]